MRARRRFSDTMYSYMIDIFVLDCVDVCIICPSHPGKIWLAKRAVDPMKGWWIMGGRRRPPMPLHEAMAAVFKRETKLVLPPRRFRLLRIHEYTWSTRKQKPRNGGTHNFTATFVVKLSPKALAAVSANLEKNEYVASKGLVPFDRAELMKLYRIDQMHPSILDLYDTIYPPRPRRRSARRARR